MAQLPWIGLHDRGIVFLLYLHVPGIITNLFSVRKLNLKGIYGRSHDQTLRIMKTNREVGVSRIVGYLHAVMTDLHKGQQQATHSRLIIRNEGHCFRPSTVGIICDQATLKEESGEKITNIPRCEDREPPGLHKDDSLQQWCELPEHPSVKEGRFKRNTRVPVRYQGFALLSAKYIQGYEKEKRKLLKDG